jgi:hypothetical protein
MAKRIGKDPLASCRGLGQVRRADASLAQHPLDRGNGQLVKDTVVVDDAVPLGPPPLNDLDAPGPIRRLHRVLDLGLHEPTLRGLDPGCYQPKRTTVV